MKLFSGIEVEGSFRGMRTLFVENIVSESQILQELRRRPNDGEHGYEQVYFGARFKGSTVSPISWEIARSIAVKFPALIVTMDVDNAGDLVAAQTVSELASNTTIMVTMKAREQANIMSLLYTARRISDPMAVRVQVKFIAGNDGVLVAPLSSFVINERSEINKDTLIWNAATRTS